MSREDFEQRVLEDLRTVKEVLTGNGNPSKGVVVRLALVEQAHASQRWWMRAVIIAAITAALGAVAAGAAAIAR